MSTITTTINTGIELGNSYASPLTVASTGFINAGTSGYNGAAIYAAAAAALTLVNDGLISIAGTGIGVLEGVTNGLTVDNAGTIASGGAGVVLLSAGPLTNSGTITSTSGYGVQGAGSNLQATNVAGGIIVGYGAGIEAANATIANYGTIRGTATAAADGIVLETSGGSIDNHGLLTGTHDAIHFYGDGSVTNSGTIIANSNWGIRLDGNGSINNSGTIFGSEEALHIIGSATLRNTGLLNGANGIAVTGAASLVNSGSI